MSTIKCLENLQNSVDVKILCNNSCVIFMLRSRLKWMYETVFTLYYIHVLLFFFQDDMNLTEEKKAPLRTRDFSFKKSMLSMHFKGTTKVSVGNKLVWVKVRLKKNAI